MIASKMPSLRLDQSDLKCKNGCDYFGNPQWQGFCSKCHREQMQKQRKAEKAISTTLPRPEQKKIDRGVKISTHSSFSKFEEKRFRQSETLKKTNLLKFSVFKKSNNTDEQDHQDRRQPEFKVPAMVNEGMKRDFRIRFPSLPSQVDLDARGFVHQFILDVIKCSSLMSVDELSERVQRQYQRFMKHMETMPHFANVDSEVKEHLMDFVEKHAMSYLHELPSVVFSPSGTDDERLDRGMSERIQQLSWLGEQQLECKLDWTSDACRQLLYKAISELLGMDRAASPGGKLSRVRRCCRHVLRLCGQSGQCGEAPASADDLLPALIFTVLKANPPRLVSNINFVTRFCNAQRLMTGEGGYYFTNLCCAVSFIENLTAESLSMDKKEFECYMAMPASIGGSSWAAALSLCGAKREADEQSAFAQRLLLTTDDVIARADQMADDAQTFEEQIAKKVQDVLAKTPLEIKPRRELPRLGRSKQMPLIDFDVTTQEPAPVEPKVEESIFEPTVKIENTEEPLNILGFEVVDKSPEKSPQHLDHMWDLKQTNSMELLTTSSPLGFAPFDSRSIDELMTPDEFGSDQLPGLSNINYDIDLSDFSGDNSIAEDKPKDPFSPDGLKTTFDPFAPLPRDGKSILDHFDEFSLVDSANKSSDAFEVIQRDPFSPEKRDPFSPIKETPHTSSFDPFKPLNSKDPFSPPSKDETPKNLSILDDSDSPTGTCLLPSPLVPQSKGDAS